MVMNPRTAYLNLPLPHEKNDLREDLPRLIAQANGFAAHAKTTDTALAARLAQAEAADVAIATFKAHSQITDTALAARLAQANAADEAIAALQERATATEQAQEQSLQTLSASLTAEADSREAACGAEAMAREAGDTAEATARAQALAAHDASLTAHDALIKRITVGSLSPVIGICCVENGGGSGLWFNIDANGQPVSPPRSYFDYHPTYNALRRVLVDGQIMEEHSKFIYKAFNIPSGPFAGKKGRLISLTKLDGFKPFPSFMKDGREIDKWYCGTFAGTNEGGTPVKIGSRPGKYPIVSLDFPTMRQYCQNRNVGGVTGFDMWDIYQVSEIQLLALIEAATTDTQAFYGRGRVDAGSAERVDATDVATASWRGHVGLWGNVWQMVNGLDLSSTGTVRIWRNDGSRQFVNTGFACPSGSASYIATLKTGSGAGYDFDDIFFPATVGGIDVATMPDGYWASGANNVLYLGALWHGGGLAGLFACNLIPPASYSAIDLGCRRAKR